MTVEIEIEGKALLTEEQFMYAMHHFHLSIDDAIVQTNYYFETDDLSLKENRSALRIRKKENHYTLTLKQPHDEGVLETNESISEQQWQLAIEKHLFPDGEVVKKLHTMQIDLNNLAFIGELQTKRIEIPYEGGLLCFDINDYLRKTDYEIEFEGKSEMHVQNVLTHLFSTLRLSPKTADNKIKRFYMRKKEVSS